MGIGVVNCLYYNPELDRYWLVDSRIYQPDQDGKKKYEHLQDMLLKAIERGVKFRCVLMDIWYAINKIMCWIDGLGYQFVCPIRSNRLVLDRWRDPEKPIYRAVKDLPWQDDAELASGKRAKLKECPLSLKLFRVTIHSNRTDYVLTNDHKHIGTSGEATKACQAKNAKAQRKHMITSMLVWIVLNA